MMKLSEEQFLWIKQNLDQLMIYNNFPIQAAVIVKKLLKIINNNDKNLPSIKIKHSQFKRKQQNNPNCNVYQIKRSDKNREKVTQQKLKCQQKQKTTNNNQHFIINTRTISKDLNLDQIVKLKIKTLTKQNNQLHIQLLTIKQQLQSIKNCKISSNFNQKQIKQSVNTLLKAYQERQSEYLEELKNIRYKYNQLMDLIHQDPLFQKQYIKRLIKHKRYQIPKWIDIIQRNQFSQNKSNQKCGLGPTPIQTQFLQLKEQYRKITIKLTDTQNKLYNRELQISRLQRLSQNDSTNIKKIIFDSTLMKKNQQIQQLKAEICRLNKNKQNITSNNNKRRSQNRKQISHYSPQYKLQMKNNEKISRVKSQINLQKNIQTQISNNNKNNLQKQNINTNVLNGGYLSPMRSTSRLDHHKCCVKSRQKEKQIGLSIENRNKSIKKQLSSQICQLHSKIQQLNRRLIQKDITINQLRKEMSLSIASKRSLFQRIKPTKSSQHVENILKSNNKNKNDTGVGNYAFGKNFINKSRSNEKRTIYSNSNDNHIINIGIEQVKQKEEQSSCIEQNSNHKYKQKQIIQMQAQIENLTSKILKYQNQIQKYQKQSDLLKQANVNLQNIILLLKDDKIKQKKKQPSLARIKSQQKIKKQKTNLDNNFNFYGTTSYTNKDQQTIIRLKKQLSNCQRQKQQLSNLLQQKEILLQKLTKNNKNLNQEVRKSKNLIDSRSTQSTVSLQREIQSLKSHLKKQETTRTHTSKSYAQLSEEMNDLIKLREKDVEYFGLKEIQTKQQLKKQELDIVRICEKNQILQQKIVKRQSQIVRLKETIQQNKFHFQRLIEQIGELQHKCLLYQAESSSLFRKIKQLQQDVQLKEKILSKINQNKEAQKNFKQISQMQTANQYRQKINKYEQLIRNLQNQLKKNRILLQDQKSAKIKLQKKIQSLLKNVQHLQRTNNLLIDQNKRYQEIFAQISENKQMAVTSVNSTTISATYKKDTVIQHQSKK